MKLKFNFVFSNTPFIISLIFVFNICSNLTRPVFSRDIKNTSRANKNRFGQLISFGSGMELNNPTDPYGLSKRIIWDIIKNDPKLNNIRIFGVFDENELPTRFIKTNLNNYINKKPLIIHQDKQFDFIYMNF